MNKSAMQSHRLMGTHHLNSQSSIQNLMTQSNQNLAIMNSGASTQGPQLNLESNFTGGNSMVDGINKSLSHSTSTTGVQKNRSRVKPQAEGQFIQPMANYEIDNVNILD